MIQISYLTMRTIHGQTIYLIQKNLSAVKETMNITGKKIMVMNLLIKTKNHLNRQMLLNLLITKALCQKGRTKIGSL